MGSLIMEKNGADASDPQKHDRDSHRTRATTGFAHNFQQDHGTQIDQHEQGQDNGDDKTIVSLAEALDGDNFNLEQFLKDVVRLGRKNNITQRDLGVVFQDLRVQGLAAAAKYQSTVGSTLNPLSLVEKIRELRHPPIRDILTGFEGVVNPGEMLLVLGRPGAGCTTFLKTLSNQHEEFHSVTGLLRFSTFTPKEISKHFRGDVIFVPEDDVHFPTLTVEQTLNFAARTHMPSKKARLEGFSRLHYTEVVVNALTTIFGLKHTMKTKVGNAMVRGISGGERKRVSLSEALAVRARLGAWDNATRGLDSSTALEFVNSLRLATGILGFTSIMSAYQASELLYELFDKVCVIYEGRMVYYGLANIARQYFIDQGWQPANRQTTPDFLTSITDPNARTVCEGFENRVPRTADEMALAFQRHPLAEENRRQIAFFLAANVIMDFGSVQITGKLPNVPAISREEKELKRRSYIESAQAERSKHMRPESPYTISLYDQIWEVMIRRAHIVRGDWQAQVITMIAYAVQAIIMGTMFFDVAEATNAYFSRGGVLFFSIVFDALSSMGEIASLYAQRPIVHRQAKAAMYHPFTEAVALTIVDIPTTVIRLVVFVVIIYFLVGLQQTAGQFFICYLFILLVSLTMRAFYRGIAASTKQESVAQSIGGVATLGLALYTGYAIPKLAMIGALEWIAYINPLSYGFEAVMANEFHTLNGTCSQIVPIGPGYENVSLANQVCTTVGSVTGQATVDGNRFLELSYGYSYSNLWRNFGINIAFFVGFLACLLVFTEYNTASKMETATTMYKRNARRAYVSGSRGTDEEKGHADDNQEERRRPRQSTGQTEKAMAATQHTSDIFSWQNLRYTVPIGKGETRLLLDDVSGYVVPGKLTALMGESGAGKTTLLNVLAGRTDIGVVTGDRFVNGQALPHDFEAQTGYCQQLDTHLPETTVREALLFSAKLRQPARVPLAEKEAYVETCLRMCGMEEYADAIVGTLDVEHRKRTTIGVELAAKPRLLLFLDEPTTGLDGQSAWAVMSFLRDLAENGQAILCTIHQPSGELFQKFDRLLLLQMGGQMVYFGDLGPNCSTMINYFERNGARKCEEKDNPAEWMLDVIGAGATATSTIDWYDVWEKSDEAAKFKIHLREIHEEGHKKPPVHATHQSEFATPWIVQLYELTKRANLSYWRNPTYVMSKQFLNIAAGLFIGFTFFQANNTVQGTQDKIFGIFILTMISAAHAFQLQVPFLNFISIYQVRERPSRTYSWTSLVASALLVEIPWNVLGSTLLFLCWYWTVGFDSDRAGYTYLVISIWFPLFYTTMSHAVASMSPNAVIDSVLFSVLFSFIIVFSGVLQPYSQRGWWKWMYRVAPFTYFIEGVLGQTLGGSEVRCSPSELAIIDPPNSQTCGQYLNNYIAFAGGYLQNPDAISNCEFCPYRFANQFLELSFNIFYKNHWRDFGLLMVYVAFNIAATYALTYIFRIRLRH
ncbi:SNQ2_4 [Sanghuangporus sanghuang]